MLPDVKGTSMVKLVGGFPVLKTAAQQTANRGSSAPTVMVKVGTMMVGHLYGKDDKRVMRRAKLTEIYVGELSLKWYSTVYGQPCRPRRMTGVLERTLY